MDIAQMFVRSI